MATVTITAVPADCDDKVPFEYGREGFLGWVWEVFQEGYKKDVKLLTLEQSVDLVQSFGYEVEVECDEECAEHDAECDGFCDHIDHENGCGGLAELKKDVAFLRDLAARILYIPANYNVDQGDSDRLRMLADRLGGHLD